MRGLSAKMEGNFLPSQFWGLPNVQLPELLLVAKGNMFEFRRTWIPPRLSHGYFCLLDQIIQRILIDAHLNYLLF